MNKEIILKPTGVIQITNKFSLIERKLLNAIIWHSQKNRFDGQERIIPVREIFRLLGLENSQNYEIIKDGLRALISTIIEWNLFGDDRIQEWGVCTFLASGKIASGQMKYRLNPELVDKINSPILFAKIQLLIQSQFRKRHSLVLYEFFIDNLSRSRVRKITMDAVSLDKIQSLLGVEENKYTEDGNFKFFNRDILKPSFREINELSDLKAEFVPLRKSRKVVALTFTVELKDSFPLEILNDPEKFLEHEVLGDKHIKDDSTASLTKQLIDMGIGKRKTGQLVKNHSRERIQANIDLVKKLKDKGKTIESTAAYLISAIEEDYQANQEYEKIVETEEKIMLQKTTTEKASKTQLEQEWKRFVEKRLFENYESRPGSWKKNKQEDFLKRISEDKNLVLLQAHKKHGFESRILMKSLLIELKSELLTQPEELSFDEYLNFIESNNKVR